MWPPGRGIDASEMREEPSGPCPLAGAPRRLSRERFPHRRTARCPAALPAPPERGRAVRRPQPTTTRGQHPERLIIARASGQPPDRFAQRKAARRRRRSRGPSPCTATRGTVARRIGLVALPSVTRRWCTGRIAMKGASEDSTGTAASARTPTSRSASSARVSARIDDRARCGNPDRLLASENRADRTVTHHGEPVQNRPGEAALGHDPTGAGRGVHDMRGGPVGSGDRP